MDNAIGLPGYEEPPAMRGVEAGSEHFFAPPKQWNGANLHPCGLMQQVLWLNVQTSEDTVSFSYPALVYVLKRYQEIKDAVTKVAPGVNEEELNRRVYYQWHADYPERPKLRMEVSMFIATFKNRKELKRCIQLGSEIIKE